MIEYVKVRSYSATIKITDDGDGSCTVEWTGTFEPKGASIYTGGIEGARKSLGV